MCYILLMYIVFHQVIMCTPGYINTTGLPGTSNITNNNNNIIMTTRSTYWESTTNNNYYTTRPPKLLKLGNQTVDVNKSFKVPSSNSIREQSDNKTVISAASETNNTITTTTTTTITTSSAPVLLKPWQNIIKHEHETKYGPRFEDNYGHNITIVVQSGDTALLDCKVSLLRDKTVSWVRRRPGEPPLLLTVGGQTYTGDTRFAVQFRYPGNWRLQLTKAQPADEGLYECQLSTHPPRIITVTLHVNSLIVTVVDDAGDPLKEQYYETGSTLSLRCEIRGSSLTQEDKLDNVDKEEEGIVWWIHGDKQLQRDTTRGGVQVKSERTSLGSNSHIRVSRLTSSDAGNYTCALPSLLTNHRPRYMYTVLVHVLNESLAELQQGSCNSGTCCPLLLLVTTIITHIISPHIL